MHDSLVFYDQLILTVTQFTIYLISDESSALVFEYYIFVALTEYFSDISLLLVVFPFLTFHPPQLSKTCQDIAAEEATVATTPNPQSRMN